MLRRHDLLRAEPPAWDAMLRCHPGLADLPLIADWALREWPVIARRCVSHVDSGSHADMDAWTFRASVAAITPFFGRLTLKTII
jgi:hypothetical protein